MASPKTHSSSFSSVTQSCLTLCNSMDYPAHEIFQARILEYIAFPFSRGSSQPRDQTQVSHIAGGFFTSWVNSWSLLKLMSIESVMPSNHLILCCPLLLLPSIFTSIRVISNESAVHIRWPQYWSFSLSISPHSEYLGFISFRIDWFDCPAVQGTLKSLFQHHSSKASILRCSAFFMVQHSHAYMTAGKTIALTRQTFVGTVHGILYSLWSSLYSPWNSPGQNTGVGRLSLLQGIFPTQGSNPGLLHCRQILYQLSDQGSPRILEW